MKPLLFFVPLGLLCFTFSTAFAADTPAKGIKVKLERASDGVIVSTEMSDNAGHVGFTKVPAGKYMIVVDRSVLTPKATGAGAPPVTTTDSTGSLTTKTSYKASMINVNSSEKIANGGAIQGVLPKVKITGNVDKSGTEVTATSAVGLSQPVTVKDGGAAGQKVEVVLMRSE